MNYVMAIDAGTTGIRTLIFDDKGKILGQGYREFPSVFPQPSWVEQDAESWWQTLGFTTQAALRNANISPSDILAISVTNQRETIVPCDENGKPLRNAIVWQDRRTVPQCDWIKKNIGMDKIYYTTGLTVDPYFSAPKILWIKENEPEIYDRTYKFLLVHDFLIMRMSDEWITDYSNASRTMLFDIETGEWSEDLLEAMEIPKEKLPDPVPSGVKIGELTESAAKHLGLVSGITIVSGGGDQQCAALGVGVSSPGKVKSTTGTGTFVLAYLDRPVRDPKLRLLCSRHVIKDKFVMEASIFTTGSTLKWYRDQFGLYEVEEAKKKNIDPYEILTQEASEAPPGSEGVIILPHFMGAGAPYWNPKARGVISGLALGHSKNHIIRAILESVGYEIRANLEIMKERGINISELRITGGASRSDIWNQIQADIIGSKIVKTRVEEATAMGAAILAFIGAGRFKDVQEATENMVRVDKHYLPDEKAHNIYNNMFQAYTKLYEALAESGFYEIIAEYDKYN